MTVVAFRAAAPEPTSRQVSVYCVQTYWRDRRGLAKGRFEQFGSMELALKAGKAASIKAAGVSVYLIKGYAGSEVWSDPRVIASYGSVPSDVGVG